MRPLTKSEIEANAHAAAERAYWMLRACHTWDVEGAGAPRRVVRLAKAAVAGLGTVDAAALAEARLETEGLVAATEGASYFDALRVDSWPSEFHAVFAAATTHATGDVIGEGRAIPATKFDAARKTLSEQTAAAIIVVSKDILRFAHAPGLLERMLRAAIARATDAEFIGQLTNGATSIAASGSDSESVFFDLRRALAAINSGADARFHIGLGSALCKRLALQTDLDGRLAHPQLTPTGGLLAGMPATVTEQLTDDVVIADARGLLTASGDVRFEVGNSAAIQMDTAPSNASIDASSPPAPAPTSLVSMFQTNSAALRIQRQFDWTPLRAGPAAVITGAGSLWGLNGASPPV